MVGSPGFHERNRLDRFERGTGECRPKGFTYMVHQLSIWTHHHYGAAVRAFNLVTACNLNQYLSHD
ncbi:hypothetical protein D3C87_1184170 [compost metagenome]